MRTPLRPRQLVVLGAITRGEVHRDERFEYVWDNQEIDNFSHRTVSQTVYILEDLGFIVLFTDGRLEPTAAGRAAVVPR